jgi:hypothetical protein
MALIFSFWEGVGNIRFGLGSTFATHISLVVGLLPSTNGLGYIASPRQRARPK